MEAIPLHCKCYLTQNSDPYFLPFIQIRFCLRLYFRRYVMQVDKHYQPYLEGLREFVENRLKPVGILQIILFTCNWITLTCFITKIGATRNVRKGIRRCQTMSSREYCRHLWLSLSSFLIDSIHSTTDFLHIAFEMYYSFDSINKHWNANPIVFFSSRAATWKCAQYIYLFVIYTRRIKWHLNGYEFEFKRILTSILNSQ